MQTRRQWLAGSAALTLPAVVKRRAGFEVWVTHMFVFSAPLGEGAGSGEGVLLGVGEDGAPQVRLRVTGLRT